MKPFTIDKGEDSSPFGARTMEVVAYVDAINEVEYHKSKWIRYEQQYILPCFEKAKELGINLQQLVMDNPGKNCVELLVETLITRLE